MYPIVDGPYTLLANASLLVVEDEILVLLELEAILREAGAEDIHLCRDVASALARIESDKITAAILDVRLGQQVVTPVARALAERGTPFLFYTGQAATEPLLKEWPKNRILPKPARSHTIVEALEKLIQRERTPLAC
jgi:DNA-binding NtrC family response regulator